MCKIHNFLTLFCMPGKLGVPQGSHMIYYHSWVIYQSVFGFITHAYISPCRLRADTFAWPRLQANLDHWNMTPFFRCISLFFRHKSVLHTWIGWVTAVSSRRTCKEVPKKRLAADFQLMNKAENLLGKVMKMRSFLETAFRKLPRHPRGRRIPLGVCFKFLKFSGSWKRFAKDRKGDSRAEETWN